MRDVPGEFCGFIATFLNVLQSYSSKPGILRTLLVERRDLGIEIPAVVVELARDGLDFGQRLLLEMLKSDNHIGDLHAGIVDVVLHFNLTRAETEQARERV